MEDEISGEVEELTGRKVIGFMSDNHIDPALRSRSSSWNRSPPVPRSRTRASRPPSMFCGPVLRCGHGPTRPSWEGVEGTPDPAARHTALRGQMPRHMQRAMGELRG